MYKYELKITDPEGNQIFMVLGSEMDEMSARAAMLDHLRVQRWSATIKLKQTSGVAVERIVLCGRNELDLFKSAVEWCKDQAVKMGFPCDSVKPDFKKGRADWHVFNMGDDYFFTIVMTDQSSR